MQACMVNETQDSGEFSLFEKKIQIFDATTIHLLKWPQDSKKKLTKNFLISFLKHSPQAYIDNVSAKSFVLQIGDTILPLVVAENNFEDSYVCSIYSQYVSYALAVIPSITSTLLRWIAGPLVRGFGVFGKPGKINSVVYVNNWLFSTDLYPKDLSQNDLSLLFACLKKRFPSHAFVFRSLTPLLNQNLQENLKNIGCQFIANRQVYITDMKKEDIFHIRIIKSDLKLWEKYTSLVTEEKKFSKEEYNVIAELYKKTYIDSHSALNPQFNETYLHLLAEEGILHFKVLRIDEKIVGVAGYLIQENVLFCPFLGYDKDHKEHALLYRILSTALFVEAKKRQLIFHQSAGASFYKKIRRAEGTLETMAVYTKHLPLWRKIPWVVLRGIINTFAISFMKSY